LFDPGISEETIVTNNRWFWVVWEKTRQNTIYRSMAESPRNWQSLMQQLQETQSSPEREELDTWRQESADHEAWMEEELQPEALMSEVDIELRRDDGAIRRKFEYLREEHEMMMSRARARVFKMWQRAAAVVLVLVAGTIFYMRGKRELSSTPALADFDPSIREEDMMKAPRRPKLTSDKGNTLRLDDIPIGEIRQQEGLQVTRTDKYEIFLSWLNEQKGNASELSRAIVAIPYGESWTVSLPDSSRIQLAPGSSLAWRMNPGGGKKERAFALYGEAWCDMSADPNAPVFISTLKGSVVVLGTRFDVRDRLKDPGFVSLETGRVRIDISGRSKVLRPGEEGRMSLLRGEIPVIAAGAAPVRTEWRDTLFTFSGRNIKQVVQQIVEWYGLKGARFDNNVDTVRAGVLGGGYAAKDLPVRQLLIQCETVDIGLEIDKGEIHVYKK